MSGSDAVQQGVVAFATILGSIALLAGAATLCELNPAIDCSGGADDSSGLPSPHTSALRLPAVTCPCCLLPLHRLAAALPPCTEKVTPSARGSWAQVNLLQAKPASLLKVCMS